MNTSAKYTQLVEQFSYRLILTHLSLDCFISEFQTHLLAIHPAFRDLIYFKRIDGFVNFNLYVHLLVMNTDLTHFNALLYVEMILECGKECSF